MNEASRNRRAKIKNGNTSIEPVLEKVCSLCHQTKLASEFHANKYAKTGLTSWCKECTLRSMSERWERDPTMREKNRQWRRDHPDLVKLAYQKWANNNPERNRKAALAHYGLTIEQYSDMLRNQNHVCAVCKRPSDAKNLSVDHCHVPGKVRGLLCLNCNSAAGYLKDDPDMADALAEYLRAHKKESVA